MSKDCLGTQNIEGSVILFEPLMSIAPADFITQVATDALASSPYFCMQAARGARTRWTSRLLLT